MYGEVPVAGVYSISSPVAFTSIWRLSSILYCEPTILSFYLQGVFHWKIRLLPSWSPSCQQVTKIICSRPVRPIYRKALTPLNSAVAGVSCTSFVGCMFIHFLSLLIPMGDWPNYFPVWQQQSLSRELYRMGSSWHHELPIFSSFKRFMFSAYLFSIHPSCHSLSLPVLCTSSQPLHLQFWALWLTRRGGMWFGC